MRSCTDIMKIKIIIENNPSPSDKDLLSEHGFSAWIGCGGKCYMMDVGATGKWSENALKIGVNVADVDYLILSHGHIDHTGGLSTFLRLNTKAKVIASSKIDNYSYSSYRHIGKPHDLTPDKEILSKYRSRISYIDSDDVITDNMKLVYNSVSRYAVPYGNQFLKVCRVDQMERQYMADDEISLVLTTVKGLVIISSCSHCGILNIIESCCKSTGIHQVAAYIGGLHLIDNQGAAGDDIKEIADVIRSKYPDMKLYAGHCTGSRAKEILSSELGSQLETLYSGKEIEISSATGQIF